MKQATVKLPSGDFCFQEVPEWAKDIKAYYKPLIELTMVDWLDQAENYVYPVHIPGSWQLLGADPTRLTEVEAGEIVETVSGWDNVIYYNYNASGRDYRDIVEAAFKSPAASLDSLAASLGISKPYCVLKNIEK